MKIPEASEHLAVDFSEHQRVIFCGYRFPTPLSPNYIQNVNRNAETLISRDKMGKDFRENPLWSRLLEFKLETMLGFPTEVPRLKDHCQSYYLFQFGEVFLGPVIGLRLSPGYCHTNSAYLWQSNQPKLDLIHGFVMRKGEWFRHSWCVAEGDRQVLETTQKMDFYFGFRFPKQMARDFCQNELTSEFDLESARKRKKSRTTKTIRSGLTLDLLIPPIFPSVSNTSVV